MLEDNKITFLFLLFPAARKDTPGEKEALYLSIGDIKIAQSNLDFKNRVMLSSSPPG